MDFFHILGAGARFDKKRFKEDLEVFHTTNPSQKKLSDLNNEQVVSSELDFFGTDADSIAQKQKEKKDELKHQKQQEQEANEEDDEILSSNVVPEPFKNQEQVNIFRKQHRIRIYGENVPNPVRNFAEMSELFQLRPFLRKSLEENGYKKPTPIQMQAFPIVAKGRDIMACAPTGSGKTLGFLLPILQDLKAPAKEGYRAVIVSPTRELAQQIYRECKKLCMNKPFKICVLTKMNVQNDKNLEQVRHFDILITTPARLVHALQHESVDLSKVRHLVLDEADKLLETGTFLEQMDDIMAACTNDNLVKSLFSATIPSSVEELARSVMADPVRIVIGEKNAATETINQKLLFVSSEEGKLIAIRQSIQEGLKPPVLIFVQSIERAKELFHELVYDGINVDVMHSERTKAQRDNLVQNFRMGKIWVLICTELMARGIDFKGVNLVINYDFPQSVQSYIHRIGRTGRAGRPGTAITYFTRDDAPHLRTVANVMKQSGCDVPEWMLQLQKPTKEMKKKLKSNPLERRTIDTTSNWEKNKMQKRKEMIEASKKRKQRLASSEGGEKSSKKQRIGTN